MSLDCEHVPGDSGHANNLGNTTSVDCAVEWRDRKQCAVTGLNCERKSCCRRSRCHGHGRNDKVAVRVEGHYLIAAKCKSNSSRSRARVLLFSPSPESSPRHSRLLTHPKARDHSSAQHGTKWLFH